MPSSYHGLGHAASARRQSSDASFALYDDKSPCSGVGGGPGWGSACVFSRWATGSSLS